jgi:hypothetical protein
LYDIVKGGKPKRPAPNEGPLGLLVYGGTGTGGFVVFMVIAVVIAIVGSALGPML